MTSNASLTPFFFCIRICCLFLEKRLSSDFMKVLEFTIPITPENEKNGMDMCVFVFFGAQRGGVGIRYI